MAQDQQHLEHLAQIRSEMQLRLGGMEKDLEEQKEQTKAIQDELKSLREVATQFRFMAGIGGGGGMIGILVGIITLAKAFIGQ